MICESFKIDFPVEMIREGRIKILVPKLKAFVKSPSEYAPSKAPVFYNPVMELNRDIAVLALQTFQKTVNRKISVCEPLSSSGIRGIRFASEVKGIKNVLINDINKKAFQLAKYNVENTSLSSQLIVKNEEANRLMSYYNVPLNRFDAVDIDPFGSPTPYLDSAIRALRNGGLLALTATDMAPLCGIHPKACIRKYGGKPLRTEYCHELAVRLLVGCLATTAAKQDIGIKIVLSHFTNHYIRVYARIYYGAKKGDESIKNLGYILHCFTCFHREIIKGLFNIPESRKCSECGSMVNFAGPLWVEKIAEKRFLELMQRKAKYMPFKNSGKITKILKLIENAINAPIGYYALDKLAHKLSLPVPSIQALLKILHQYGFKATRTHFNTEGIKTDASSAIMKEFFKKVVITGKLQSGK